MNSDGNMSINWDTFVDECLLSHKVDFALQYNSLGTVKPSAVTYVVEGLLRRAQSCGYPGIVVGVCDYTREAIAFAMSRIIDNVLSLDPHLQDVIQNLSIGDPIAIGNIVVEYQGIEHIKFQEVEKPYLVYKQRSTKKANRGVINKYPIDKICMFHPCFPGTQISSSKGKTVPNAIADYRNHSNNVALLLDRLSSVRSSVAIATSVSPYANVPPTLIEKGSLIIEGEEISLCDCFISARYSKGEIKRDGWKYIDGTPSLLAVSRSPEGVADLFDICECLEDGGSIDLLIIEAPTIESIESQRFDLEKIIGTFRVPVIVFCEEELLDRTQVFSDLNLISFSFGQRLLQKLISCSISQFIQLTPRERNVANSLSAVRSYVVHDDGRFSSVARVLISLNRNCRWLSREERDALLVLVRLFNQLLRQTEMIDEMTSTDLLAKIDRAMAVLAGDSGSYSLELSQIEDLRYAEQKLRELCRPDVALPKENVAYDRILDAIINRHHPVCMIASNKLSEKSSQAYWRQVLSDEGVDPSFFRAVTVSSFLKYGCIFDDEEVFLSGWFRCSEMLRLTRSGLAQWYSVFMYKGIDQVELETKWSVDVDSLWRAQCVKQAKASIAAFNNLSIVASQESQNASSSTLINNGRSISCMADSLPDISHRMECERDEAQKASPGEKSALGRCVRFDNGVRRWLRVTENGGDTVVVVTNLLDEEGEECRKTANTLQEGDIVLRIDSDDSKLDEACREFGSYDVAVGVARGWYAAIEMAKRSMTVSEMIQNIQNAGCLKNQATIKRWIRDSAVIAPQDKGDITIIGKALDYEFSDAEVNRIMHAARAVRGGRITGGRQLSKETVDAFVEDAREFGNLEQAECNFTTRHCRLSAVELLCVDYVGNPVMVPEGKFGRFIDLGAGYD